MLCHVLCSTSAFNGSTPVLVPRSSTFGSAFVSPARSCQNLIRYRPRSVVQSCSIRVLSSILVDPSNESHVSKFADLVSGDWSGFESSFSRTDASVITLESVDIPDEFREWGMIPKGYEFSHSVCVRDSKIIRKLYRVLPSVCVFGEHIDVEEEKYKFDLQNKTENYAFLDGGYSAGPQTLPLEQPGYKQAQKLDFCIPKFFDSDGFCDERVLVRVGIDMQRECIGSDVQVFVEKYEQKYSGGQYVSGGSGLRIGWSEEPALDRGILNGRWKVSRKYKSISDENEDEIEIERENGFETENRKKLWMPRGLSVQVDKEGEFVSVEVGWLQNIEESDKHLRSIMKRAYSTQDGSLAYVNYHTEHKV